MENQPNQLPNPPEVPVPPVINNVPPVQQSPSVAVQPSPVVPATTTSPIQIESNTGHNQRTYILAHHKIAFIASVVAEIIIGVIGIVVAISTKNAQGLIYLLGAPLLIVWGGWFGWASGKLETQLLQQYAKLHGYNFIPKPADFNPTGPLFTIGSSRKNYDLVTGNLQGAKQFYLFFHKMTVGHGKSSSTYTYTVVSLALLEPGPHLFLRHQKHMDEVGPSAINASFNTPKQYQLEGDFDKAFKLYGETGDQVNLLEVINPAVMEKLLLLTDYDIEVNGYTLSIYRMRVPQSADELDKVLEVAQLLVATFGPIMQRMQASSQTVA